MALDGGSCVLTVSSLMLMSSFFVQFFQPREALLRFAKKADGDPMWTKGELLFMSSRGLCVAQQNIVDWTT